MYRTRGASATRSRSHGLLRLTPYGVRRICCALRKDHGGPESTQSGRGGGECLKARAKAKGVSLEEEVRRVLTASIAADREELLRRARALHAAAGGKPGKPELDSARIIREERDAWR
jgi:plasmid stability protein